YGHHEGDKALQAVGRVLRGSVCRAGDFAFRIGGEEFAVVVAVDRCEDAYWIAEKIRRGVEDLKLEHGHSQASPYLTISVGVKTYQGSGVEAPDIKLMYRLADDALYEAKENGRNQVAGDKSSQRIVQINVGSVGS
ncbi:MAG: GGDEF domain-containing protein, partial [Gammaproteobacteria bacterium]|nr:GGDEF domain-containing protein [Gammaproteobacteria bacterium]